MTFERYSQTRILSIWSCVCFPTVISIASKLTDTDIAVWDEDPDSFDDFPAQCRWYRDGSRKSEQRLATAHVVRLFAAKGGKTWNLTQRLDSRYLREWFGLEYFLWRIREEICRPAVPEMTKYLDEYISSDSREINKESMSAWALRELQMTRTLARLEHTVDST